MGNVLEVCGHLLNDLYPHIFSYLSPRDLGALSLVSKQLLHQVTDEVWKELCRRDFAAKLEVHRQAQRALPGHGDTAAGVVDLGAEAQQGTTEKDDEKGKEKCPQKEDEEGKGESFFRKVLLTGLGLQFGRGQDKSKRSDEAATSESGLGLQSGRGQDKSKSSDQAQSYKTLYRLWTNRVLIIYHVYSNDDAEKDVERVLGLEGIDATSLVRTNSGITNKQTELELLKEQLADVLPEYRAVMYISNGGVSSQFQAAIGDALADFVERGGAAIIFPFATAKERLMGRWDELGFSPIVSEAQTSTTSSLRHPARLPDHPLLKDVRGVTASYRGIGDVANSAQPIAYYSDGSVFAAELAAGDGLVLAVNLFPPSCPLPGQRGRDGGWEATEGNDVPRVLSNAVRYALAYAVKNRSKRVG